MSDIPDDSRSLSITAVGDIMFDRRLQQPRVYYHQPAVATCIPGVALPGFPYANTNESRHWLSLDGLLVDGIGMTSHATDSIHIDLPANAGDTMYPFAAVLEELRRSPLVFGNLECPLSDNGRRARNDQCFCAPPQFAEALATAPFHVVSFANNHCMDYGEVAFSDTLHALRERGIAAIGAGFSLDEARKPALFLVNDVRIAFLGYTMIGPDSVFACDGECGAAPLNPVSVEQDIERIRSDVDLIVISAHWGNELMTTPWPWLVGFAHRLIDLGADAVFGHHPHVPGSVEIYRNRPICYSLGNFCFGHGHDVWGDNMIARLLIADGQIHTVEITAVNGTYQPRLLDSVAAAAFHQHLLHLSAPFGTAVEFQDGKSLIAIATS